MRKITLSIANGIRQVGTNNTYDTQATISSLEELTQAARYDHVGAYLKNNKRGNNNFISADSIIMDVDNNDTENSAEWLTPERLAQRLKDVEFAVVYSRNHMRDKENSTARPRFHCYMPLAETVDKATRICELKEKLLAVVPEFDAKAKDSTRLIYGVETPHGELHEGSLCVDEFLTIHAPETLTAETLGAETVTESSQPDGEPIHKHSRNETLFHTALKALQEYGKDKARDIFDKACARCEPPLSATECLKTWNSALKIATAIEDRVKARQKKVLTPRIIEETLKELGISVRFNVISKEVEVSDLPPNEFVPESYYALHGMARKRLAAELLPLVLVAHFKEKNYGVTENFVIESLSAIAAAHPLNPVLEMLKATTYDGKDRIEELYRVLGISDWKYADSMYRSFIKKWLLQAVAIALNDDGDIGNEFVLVLQARQGVGKTNLFRALAVRNEWFKEGTTIDMKDKDTIIQATQVWLAEIGELDATLKKDQASLKSFLTAHGDTYRRPYARKAETVERRTCFCATVNPTQCIRDDTGSRRYAFVHLDSIDKEFLYNSMTPEWCAQLWRQVYETLYLVNPKGFYLSEDEQDFLEKNNENFTVQLECESELRDALAWYENGDIDHEDQTETWSWQTITELKRHVSSLEKLDARKISRAITRILQSLDFEPDEFKRTVNGRTQYKLPIKRFYSD